MEISAEERRQIEKKAVAVFTRFTELYPDWEEYGPQMADLSEAFGVRLFKAEGISDLQYLEILYSFAKPSIPS